MLIAQKIVEAFILPPGLFVTVPLVLGLVWFKSSKGKASLLLLFSLFAYVLTTSTGTFLFVRPLEKSFRKEIPQRCDAIIVLGGGVLKGPEGYELRPHTFKRLIEGVELAKTYNAFLIVSGGTLPGSSQQPEATIMAQLAQRFEVPNEKVLVDAESKNTYENAKNVAKIVKELNLKELVLVTSAVHMKRAKMSFEKFKVRVHPYPVDYLCDYGPVSWIDFVPTKESLEANMLALHEIVGLLWYRLKTR
ncbi:MAG: YdcF family protein [Pseudothermotoga sp.]|uniref:YdcF family protein n=1 Tax=Pseudothermotoga TaxID=1643951 RepID=UPI00041DAA9D|nr:MULTISPECIES: YdcF family protein [Pseudothermotoga]MDI6863617.1 YdcF family protein [Pseudothermotoga sp.]